MLCSCDKKKKKDLKVITGVVSVNLYDNSSKKSDNQSGSSTNSNSIIRSSILKFPESMENSPGMLKPNIGKH